MRQSRKACRDKDLPRLIPAKSKAYERHFWHAGYDKGTPGYVNITGLQTAAADGVDLTFNAPVRQAARIDLSEFHGSATYNGPVWFPSTGRGPVSPAIQVKAPVSMVPAVSFPTSEIPTTPLVPEGLTGDPPAGQGETPMASAIAVASTGNVLAAIRAQDAATRIQLSWEDRLKGFEEAVHAEASTHSPTGIGGDRRFHAQPLYALSPELTADLSEELPRCQIVIDAIAGTGISGTWTAARAMCPLR